MVYFILFFVIKEGSGKKATTSNIRDRIVNTHVIGLLLYPKGPVIWSIKEYGNWKQKWRVPLLLCMNDGTANLTKSIFGHTSRNSGTWCVCKTTKQNGQDLKKAMWNYDSRRQSFHFSEFWHHLTRSRVLESRGRTTGASLRPLTFPSKFVHWTTNTSVITQFF